MVVMNVASYGFTLVAARVLGPLDYGAFAAMMALILVVNVVSLGFQATAARRVAVDPQHRAAIEITLSSAARRAALVLAIIAVVSAPVLSATLQLGSWLTVVPLAGAAVILTLVGTDLGILQGAERWVGFALAVVSFGLARLIVGSAVMLVWPTTFGAVMGVVAGLLVPLGVARLALRRRPGASRWDGTTSGTSGVLHEALHGTHILFAFFTLSSIDVLLARAILAPEAAGLYAAGLILTKGVLFLPYFVSVIAFPRLARGGSIRLHLWGLSAVLGIGACVVAVTALDPDLVLRFVGGAQYAPVRDELWRFALLGTMLAGVQLLVTTALARRHVGAVWWLWATVGAVVAGSRLVTTADGLLTLVLVADTLLVIVLTLVTRRDRVVEAAPSV